MLSNDVFISYRRAASEELAYTLYLGLKGRGIDPFFDYQSISSGRWLDIILRQIAARPYFLLVLAPGTLNRCVNENDILRREIQEAVRLGRVIIPLKTHNFKWEDFENYLPKDLAEVVPSYQGLAWPVQREWQDSALDRLQKNYLPLTDLELKPVPITDQDLLKENQAKENPKPTSPTLTVPPPSDNPRPANSSGNKLPPRLSGIVVLVGVAIVAIFLFMNFPLNNIFGNRTQTPTLLALSPSPTSSLTATNLPPSATYTATLTPSFTNTPTQTATESISICVIGQTVAILANSTVTATPVFLRKSPDMNQANFSSYTVFQPGTRLIVIEPVAQILNGQVWCNVRLEAPPLSGISGWVEQHSLMAALPATATRIIVRTSPPATTLPIATTPWFPTYTPVKTKTPLPLFPTNTPRS